VLSVVIPTLGRSAKLPDVLGRLREQRDAPELEVIVAVDAAGDLPEEAPADKVVIASRPGASAARNAGIREATGPVILFLGDDILASPQLAGEHQLWHDRLPAEHVAVLGYVELAGRPSAFERWLEHGIQSDYGAIEGDVAGWGQFYTTNVSVKKAFLERVGGFDEALPFLYEDLDLGRRLHDEGMELRFEPRAAPSTTIPRRSRPGRSACEPSAPPSARSSPSTPTSSPTSATACRPRRPGHRRAAAVRSSRA
jgi:glycosyltransferase involved in cell wall biosynthesis